MSMALVDDEVGPGAVGPAVVEEGAFVDVEICEVEGADAVWVQEVASADALGELAETLQQLFAQGNKDAAAKAAQVAPDATKLKAATGRYEDEAQRPKLFVVAPFDLDGCFYRAVVKARVSFTHLQVLFIDFGNTADVPVEQVYQLPEQLRALPPLALKVRLAGEGLPGDAAAKPTPDWVSKAFQDHGVACLHVQRLLSQSPVREVLGEVAVIRKAKAPVPLPAFLKDPALRAS